MNELINPNGFEIWLAEIKDGYQFNKGLNHPIWRYFESEQITLTQLKIFAKYYYLHVGFFRRYVSALLSICPFEQLQKELANNIADEYGLNGKEENYEENSHPGMFRSFLKSLSISPKEIPSLNKFEGYTFYSQFHLSIINQNLLFESIGAIVFGMEGTTPFRYRKILKGIDNINTMQKMNIDTTFFSEHVEADDHHFNDLAIQTFKFCKNNTSAIIRGANLSLNARCVFLDSLLLKMKDGHAT